MAQPNTKDQAAKPAGVRRSGRTLRISGAAPSENGMTNIPPVRGGQKSEGEARDRFAAATYDGGDQPSASREVYLLVPHGAKELETPILHPPEAGGQEALVIFSGREAAVSFLQGSRWNDYDIRDLYAPGLELLA